MTRRTIVFAGLLLLSACGGEPEEKTGALRVDVVIASADGEPPTEGWSLESESGKLLPCTIESKGPGHVVISAVGPAGRYGIKTPKGFGIVDLGPKPLTPDLPPVTAFLGRLHTLYLTPRTSAWRAIDAIVVPDGLGSRVKDELKTMRETGADGRLAIRIGPEAWKTKVVLVTALLLPPDGKFVDRVAQAGRFATVPGIKLPPDGTPTGVIVEPDAALPFRVLVYGSPRGEPLSLQRVTARIMFGDGPDHTVRWLVDHNSDTDTSGVARFDALPGGSPEMVTRLSVGDLHSRVGGFATAARGYGEARFLAPAPNSPWNGRSIAVEGFPKRTDLGAPVFSIRPQSGSSYARMHFGADGTSDTSVRFSYYLPPGTYSYFIRAGDQGRVLTAVHLEDAEARPIETRLEPLCSLQGSIVGRIGTGQPLDLFARRMEDGKPVEAEGWVLRGLVRPEFDLMLPTGEWRITAEDAAGKAGPVTECSFEKPGSRAAIKVTAPP